MDNETFLTYLLHSRVTETSNDLQSYIILELLGLSVQEEISEIMEGSLWISVLAAFAVFVITVIMEVIRFVWWKPLKIQKHFESQGIGGPPYKLFLGNAKEMVKMAHQESLKNMGFSHDILARVLPFYSQWRKTYGSAFLVWFGPTARLTIADPDLIKEIFSFKRGDYEKPESHPILKKLEGDGLPNLKGEKWMHHRRILNPAFCSENLRALIPVVAGTATNMLNKWKCSIEAGVNEIDVCEQFDNLSADIIARAAFGTSYEEGKYIFQMQFEQSIFAAEALRNFSLACLWRFFPTKKNLHQWKLAKEIRSTLIKLIRRREKATGDNRPVSTDLLGLLIDAKANSDAGDQANTSSCAIRIGDIIEECKTFFFAGKQTTSNMLTWTVILLAVHQDWQQMARKQVLDVCGSDDPDKNTLNQLKIVDMIVKESLRLYPPLVALVRRTKNQVNLGSLNLPQGMEILIPILAIHHDQTLWGDDVNEFNPARFSMGVAGAAKHPQAFIPFGVGPRTCIGRNFSMIETKVVLAMILQRFSFEISPSYRHAPTVVVMLYPQYGAQIILRPLTDST